MTKYIVEYSCLVPEYDLINYETRYHHMTHEVDGTFNSRQEAQLFIDKGFFPRPGVKDYKFTIKTANK